MGKSVESRTTFRDKETGKSHMCPIMKWDCPETVLSSLRECLYVRVQAVMQDYLCVISEEHGYMNYLKPLVVNLFNHKKIKQIPCEYFMGCTLFQRQHDDVIKWKHFPLCWLSVRGIHRSPVDEFQGSNTLPHPNFVITVTVDNLAPNGGRPLTGNILTTKINTITWNFLVITDF